MIGIIAEMEAYRSQDSRVWEIIATFISGLLACILNVLLGFDGNHLLVVRG